MENEYLKGLARCIVDLRKEINMIEKLKSEGEGIAELNEAIGGKIDMREKEIKELKRVYFTKVFGILGRSQHERDEWLKKRGY